MDKIARCPLAVADRETLISHIQSLPKNRLSPDVMKWAIELGEKPIVELLLDMGLDINGKCSDGKPIVFHLHSYGKDMSGDEYDIVSIQSQKVIKLFIQNGLDVNQVDEDNCHILRHFLNQLENELENGLDTNTMVIIEEIFAAGDGKAINMLQKAWYHNMLLVKNSTSINKIIINS